MCLLMRRTPVKCGDIILLEHVKTKKNLRSENFESPISKQQEVSCNGTNGIGDERLHSFHYFPKYDHYISFIIILFNS